MEKDELYLWEMAKAKVTFRPHALIYIIVNVLLWITWYSSNRDYESAIPWPIYPLVGWGIGLFFHYLIAYQNLGAKAVKKEFEKLKKSKKNSH